MLAIQRVRSKWTKTKVLMKSAELQRHIPLTKRYSRETFKSMLDEYGMIYVKPVNGTYGNGVIRVERVSKPGSEYRYQIQKKARYASTFDELYDSLGRYTRNKNYLVQKGIYLLKHQKRRFDIRVMVQKNLNKQWESTGIIGRLSHPRNVVTNYHSGGKLVSFERLMSSHLADPDIAAFKGRLKKLGVAVARQLQTAYPGLKEIGIDVAIGTDLKPWVLEVNTKPHPYLFRTLSDKSIFRKVRRYSIAYGGMKFNKR